VDLNLNLIVWNRTLEVVTGLATEALKNKPALELFVEEDRSSLLCSVQKCLEEGEGEAEARLFNAQGGSTLFHIKGVLLKDEDGSVVGITGSGRDITERKQAYDGMITTAPGLKVLLMSGYSVNAIHESFVLHPGIPFLQKPFAPGALARKVREVLDRK
jgi:PAS domain S-box-containing protein